MSTRKKVCPNCGAEMEQHAFVYVCMYCNTASPINGTDNTDLISENDFVEDGEEYYQYLEQNISHLKTHPELVSFEKEDNRYIVWCTKPFSPLNRQYVVFRDLKLYWKAIISKSTIEIFLQSEGNAFREIPHMAMLLDDDRCIFIHRQSLGNDKEDSPLLLDDFFFLCHSENIEFSFSENLLFEEFRTYSRRFYNLIFDRAKFYYTLHQKLLID